MLTFFNFLIHADSIEYTNNYCNRCNPDVMNSQRPIEHFEIKTIMAMGFKMYTRIMQGQCEWEKLCIIH